ncbi:tetratricopeptide repeat protein [Psychroflexus sp. MES1-P1E]|uniref:tetratricopeptide repeat protein n=1 Tax=Psychroflexus sp. MES1-P1E TaxID=2058320 RepID=UPI000C7A7AFE|nr:tetratricopeptide repeat protein [Psychroflexus sp. MES1-P1E]PKG42650.1 hypothetical protein CXF67_09150 [Psychroflexus sp. MES1-P1E]
MHEGSYNEALNNFEEALNFSTTKSNKNQVYNNIGLIHYYQEDYKNAEKFILKSIEYLNSNNNLELFYSYNNLGAISSYLKEKDKALDYMMKSYEISKNLGIKEEIGAALLNISTFYTSEGDKDRAKEFMDQCDSISLGINSIEYKKALYMMFSYNYKDLKDYQKALVYSEILKL